MKDFNIPCLFISSVLLASLSGCGGGGTESTAQTGGTDAFPTVESLGKSLFSDPRFSLTRNQSCATCHNPEQGFIDNRDNGVAGAVSLGDDGLSLGTRNAPTVAYARFSPAFSGTDQNAQGGQFLDGRASDLTEQAGGPFLNPVEMAMPDRAAVVSRLQEDSDYIAALQNFFGNDIFTNTDNAYEAITASIASFESSAEVSPFDSKYNRALTGTYTMTAVEAQGRQLFFSGGASCVRCHRTGGLPTNSASEIFTDHHYFNIGVPANSTLNAILTGLGQQTDLTANGDRGLFDNPAVSSNPATRGLFKAPSLRNVAVTAPYMHNGVFANLQTVLQFYDHQGGNAARSINPETGLPWDAPEISTGISNNRLQMPDLTDAQIDALECFLRTLTDAQFETDLPPLRAGLSCS
ncbi:MAG: methylamine utilization protein MauG [Gammaproteobacteria bacterium]|nr:methylamine utilization protein MauG [Gammaproteobacteria bacterium]MBU1725020.1 methylamine utilization protein MauG [Gammaproteobacteria bacterium]MBU2003886.1 methylamine utilization protein MauG [Gammaproteobacteria bacterium]